MFSLVWLMEENAFQSVINMKVKGKAILLIKYNKNCN